MSDRFVPACAFTEAANFSVNEQVIEAHTDQPYPNEIKRIKT